MSGQSGIFNSITEVGTNNHGIKVFTERCKDGKEYVFLQSASTSGSIADGALCYFLTGTSTVTDDVTNSKPNLVVAVNDTGSAVAAGEYFWGLVKGRGITLITNGDDDVAAGDGLVCDATAYVTRATAGVAPKYKVVGWAEADDVDGSNTVLTSVDL